MFGQRMFVYEAEKDKGGAIGVKTPVITDTPPEQMEDSAKTFTQAEVDALIKDRLGRERDKAQKALEEARKAAETETAQKNGEWQKLAEAREAELKQLQGQLREGLNPVERD